MSVPMLPSLFSLDVRVSVPMLPSLFSLDVGVSVPINYTLRMYICLFYYNRLNIFVTICGVCHGLESRLSSSLFP